MSHKCTHRGVEYASVFTRLHFQSVSPVKVLRPLEKAGPHLIKEKMPVAYCSYCVFVPVARLSCEYSINDYS